MKIRFFLLVLWLWPTALWSQVNSNDCEGTLTATLDRHSARVGSIVTLTLHHKLPKGAVLSDPMEIKGIDGLSTIEFKTGPNITTVTFLIDRLDSWKIGPISISYLDKQGDSRTLTADSIPLKMISNLGDDPETAEQKSIMEIIPKKTSGLEYFPRIALALVILYAAWILQRRNSLKRPILTVEPPHVLAKKEIRKLEELNLFENGEIKAFYFRFSEILRRYLESLRGFPAAEFTTEEIALRINWEQDQRLIALLRHVDLVKFADTVPTLSRKLKDLNNLLSYIQETSPDSDPDLPEKYPMEEAK